MSDQSVTGISICRDGYFHVYGAGPCFDTREQATAYKAELDEGGVTWKSQRRPWER